MAILRDHILRLVEEANQLNSKIVSLPRLLILTALHDLGRDGAAFRELRAGLRGAIKSDGALYANLRVLKGMGYLMEREEVVGGQRMTIFAITEDGANALAAVRRWACKWRE